MVSQLSSFECLVTDPAECVVSAIAKWRDRTNLDATSRCRLTRNAVRPQIHRKISLPGSPTRTYAAIRLKVVVRMSSEQDASWSLESCYDAWCGEVYSFAYLGLGLSEHAAAELVLTVFRRAAEEEQQGVRADLIWLLQEAWTVFHQNGCPKPRAAGIKG